MKRLLLSLCLIALVNYNFAQCIFDSLGTGNFNQPSYGVSDYTDMAKDPSGNLYVCYSDGLYNNKITVSKYSNGKWSILGSPGFSSGTVAFTSIAFDNLGIPYVVYSDIGNGRKAVVQKFNGTNWVVVGINGFSAGQADYPSISIDGNNKPYVIYRDVVNGNKVTVMENVACSWSLVGGVAGVTPVSVVYTNMDIASDGAPYIVYGSAGSGSAARRMKVSAGTRQLGVLANFSPPDVSDINIALS